MTHTSSSNWSLGVDGGGSKTLAIIVDEEGHEIGRGLSASSNHQNVGLATAISHISDAIALAMRQAQIHAVEARFIDPQAPYTGTYKAAPDTSTQHPDADDVPTTFHTAWFGLAGVDHPSDHALLFPHLQPFAHHVHLTNDAELVLSALPNTIGIALIAGTGSIALGHDAHGSSARAGGWGNLIGDEGSGYDIGRQCLQAITQASDERAQPTALTDLVLHHWHLHDPSEIIDIVYKKTDKSTIASLSPLVCSAARDNDPVACTILTNAAHSLALTVAAVKKQLAALDPQVRVGHTTRLPYADTNAAVHAQSPTNLALSGGLLLHEHDFRQHVITAISEHITLDNILLVAEPALSAAHSTLKL